MELKQTKIADLKPHPRNPRVHPESAIQKLVNSIEEYGWTNPVLVSKDGIILAGHLRVKAAEIAGLDTVPAIYLPLEGAQADAYVIADNRLQDETSWDFPTLKDLLLDLKEEDMKIDVTGFDADEIDALLGDFETIEVPDIEGGHHGGRYKKSTGELLAIGIGLHMIFLGVSRRPEMTIIWDLAEKARNAEEDEVRDEIKEKVIAALIGIAETEGFDFQEYQERFQPEPLDELDDLPELEDDENEI